MGNKVEKGLRSPLLDQSEEKITVSHIYKLNVNDLQKMFSPITKENLKFLTDHQENRGILQRLSSDAKNGIVGDEKDLDRRMKHFGKNTKPLAQPPKLYDSILQTIKEPIWKALVISALVASVFESAAVGPEGLGEGIAIIFTTFMLILITAIADYIKDTRFIALQSLIKDENIAVVRGKQGSTLSVSVWSIVVGDIILLETGSRVPADCLLIEGNDLRVCREDDSVNQLEDNSNSQPKTVYGSCENSDPFVFAGSKIIRGTGKGLVCCVGPYSSVGKQDSGSLDVNENTPLQKKLVNLEGHFTLIALWSALIILIFFSIRLGIEFSILDTESNEYIAGNLAGKTEYLLNKLTTLINILVILVVVSIPEGLPLTIGISLAFSVMKMYDQKILVRKLDAPEKMGGIQEICCGKTGTLTKNEMKVTQFYCEGKKVINNRKDTFTQCDISEQAQYRIQECILNNCDARVEMDESIYKPVGNGTEVGLLKFLQNANIPIHILINKKYEFYFDERHEMRSCILMRSPLSPENKRSSIAVRSQDGQSVAIYVTGAPEMLVDLCSNMLLGGQTGELQQDEKDKILSHINQMAMEPLRVIGMAYMECSWVTWQQNFQTEPGVNVAANFEEKLAKAERFLTWIGAFGLKDPCRPGVFESIRYARDDAQLSIRLISGDHIETAKAVAIKTGILRDKEQHFTNAVMEGAAFRQLVGMPLIQKKNELTMEMEPTDELENMNEFDSVIDELRVLARASPLDKEILVRGLRFRNRNVAVGGQNISDVGCLQIANVSVAMGSGVSAAKQASDLILIDDDFEANVQAIMWGRNIFLNVTRFLQFQVTVNFSCLLTILIGGMIIGESPFSAVQLLWINLIMDTFAAIALSTEPPIKSVTQGSPFKQNAQIITKAVGRQIIGITIWQTLVMTVMFVKMICNAKYKWWIPVDQDEQDYEGTSYEFADVGLYKRQQLTQIYNTFIFLQLFNFINCRKVGGKDFNVFEEFFHNRYFIIILVGTSLFQYFFCTKLQFISKTEEMDVSQWGSCIAAGSTVIFVSMLLKVNPKGCGDKAGEIIQKLVNEDKQVDSKVLQSYKKATVSPADDGNKAVVNDNKSDESGNKDDQVEDENEFKNV